MFYRFRRVFLFSLRLTIAAGSKVECDLLSKQESSAFARLLKNAQNLGQHHDDGLSNFYTKARIGTCLPDHCISGHRQSPRVRCKGCQRLIRYQASFAGHHRNSQTCCYYCGAGRPLDLDRVCPRNRLSSWKLGVKVHTRTSRRVRK